MAIEIENAHQLDRMIAGADLCCVKLYTPWCRPCQVLTPRYEDFSEQATHFLKNHGINAVFASENVDSNIRHNVGGVPAFVVYVGGQHSKTIIGGSLDELSAFVRGLAGVPDASPEPDPSGMGNPTAYPAQFPTAAPLSSQESPTMVGVNAVKGTRSDARIYRSLGEVGDMSQQFTRDPRPPMNRIADSNVGYVPQASSIRRFQ